ncbi:MAG: hypothetical protein MJB57_00690 [Gemmatimonadetes bacterium]|nr:hypothetical protein [Gemmatimonadota bacterium]
MTDSELRAQFEDGTLDPTLFDHRAHLRMGYLYVRAYPFDEALRRMRVGLRAHNAAHPEHIEVGYHETITRAFLTLIANACHDAAEPAEDSNAFCEAHRELSEAKVLNRYYSKELLASDTAKRTWVEPDREPLGAGVA